MMIWSGSWVRMSCSTSAHFENVPPNGVPPAVSKKAHPVVPPGSKARILIVPHSLASLPSSLRCYGRVTDREASAVSSPYGKD